MALTRALTGLTVLTLVGTLAAGCGSAATDRPGTSPGDAVVDADSAEQFTSEVDDLVTKLSEPQTATPPTDGPAAVPGKEVWIVNFIDAEAGAQRIVRGLKEGAELLGWKAVHLNSEGDPNKVHANMQQAIAAKPDAIVVVASDAALIQGDLENAAAAGIPVACNTCADLEDLDSNGPFVTIDPPVSRFADMGYASSAWAYRETKGKPRYISTNDRSLSNLAGRESGHNQFLTDCESAGADCKQLASDTFLVADLNTTFGASAAGLARANPDFNVFWVPFDYAGLQVMAGLKQAGLEDADDGKFVVSTNGDGSNLDVIAKGGEQPVTVAIGFEWGGFATMDNLNRHFAGEPVVEQNTPVRLFDATNAQEAQGGDWDGDVDFRKYYSDLWSGQK